VKNQKSKNRRDLSSFSWMTENYDRLLISDDQREDNYEAFDHNPELQETPKWSRTKSIVLASGCACSTFVAAFLFFLFVCLPALAQTVLDESTLIPLRMYMRNATNRTIILQSVSELHDVGPLGARLLEAFVEIHHKGDTLGHMMLPELDIKGGQVLRFEMESVLTVTNFTAFTRATAEILQGIGGQWKIKGNGTVEIKLAGITRSVAVDLNKDFLIPATLLEDVRGYDGQVVEGSGTENELLLTARTSMFSSSILEMHDLGEFVFDLNVLTGEESDIKKFVKVGEVSVDNFDVRQGLNDLRSRGKIIKTPENEAVLSTFMAGYLMGNDQLAYLHGPTNSSSIFLDNVVEQKIIFAGSNDSKPVLVSMINKDWTLVGFTPDLPGATTFRGPIVTVHNTLTATVIQRNITNSIFLVEPIEYQFKHRLLGSHHCKRSDKFVKLYSAPGMYKNNSTREPVVEFHPQQTKSVFLPGRPLKDQSTGKPCTVLTKYLADGADCCFVSSPIASACRAKSRGEMFFLTNLYSDFIMQLGEFRIPLLVTQNNIQTMFTSEVTEGFLQDAEISCSNFEFL